MARLARLARLALLARLVRLWHGWCVVMGFQLRPRGWACGLIYVATPGHEFRPRTLCQK